MKSLVLSKNQNKVGIINTNNSLFNLINPNSDIKFSSMSDIMLDVFFELLKGYDLEYRSTLNFKKTSTFGFEVEFENADFYNIRKYLSSMHTDWPLLFDPSIKKGAEIPTPILKDNKKSWDEVKDLCDTLRKYSNITGDCGGHIHVGWQVLGDSNINVLNFLKLWSTYEHVIYRFSYGEDEGPRDVLTEYARPISNDFWLAYNEFKYITLVPKDDIIRRVSTTRNIGASLKYLLPYERPDINTIEFRCPNGTLNPIIWQNNVNLFVKLLDYCKKSNFDNNTVQIRHGMRENVYSHLDKYSYIYLEDALEFADLIFNNGLDKIYFLKQYVKQKNVR